MLFSEHFTKNGVTSSIGFMVFKSGEVCLAQKHPLKINYFKQKLEWKF